MDDLTPTRIERIDYATAFPFTRIFQSFRLAIHPSRLVLALCFIVLAWIAGWILDAIYWNSQVVVKPFDITSTHYEWDMFRLKPVEEFPKWQADTLAAASPEEKRGVFQEVVAVQKDLFQNMISAAIDLRVGFDQLHPSASPDDSTVLGSIRLMTLSLPAWLWASHRWFFIFYSALLLALWALFGGALSRQMIVGAATDRIVPMSEAVAYSASGWRRYFVGPLLPLGVILICWGVLWLFGLLFHIWGINILAGALYFLAIAAGWVMALALILWFAGVHLIYPALSAQGPDTVDSVSRALSYVLGRPWQLLLQTLVALIYGAVTYVFVGLFIYLMLSLAHWGVNGSGSLEGVFDAPRFGQWPEPAANLEGTDRPTAFLIHLWVYLAIAGLAAYAISYYFAAYSQIYLLLRKSYDGDDPADIYEAPLTPALAASTSEPIPSTSPPTTTGDADST